MTEPRCPECGYGFTWTELFTDSPIHPYLFEHKSPLHRSFLSTLLHGFVPWRFWSSLSPRHEVNQRRLAQYAWLVVLIAMMPIGIAFGSWVLEPAPTPGTVSTWQWSQLFGPTAPPQRFLWITTHQSWLAFWDPDGHTFLGRIHRMPFDSALSMFLGLMGAYVLWAFVTFGLLMIFQSSMGKAGVKVKHVARCVIYSFDAVVPFALLLSIALAMDFCLNLTPVMEDSIGQAFIFACVVLVAVVIWRLLSAYRRYLRFRHAALVVLSVQLIAFLALLLWNYS